MDEHTLITVPGSNSEDRTTLATGFSETTGGMKHGRAAVGLSVASMLFACGVALASALAVSFQTNPSLLCSSQRLHGANIAHALGFIGFAGVGVTVVILCVRRRQRPLAFVLLLGAATLSVAIALVALDSATYQANVTCVTLLGEENGTLVAHVGYLYGLWGAPLALLLCAAILTRRVRADGDPRLRSTTRPEVHLPPASIYGLSGWEKRAERPPPFRGQSTRPLGVEQSDLPPAGKATNDLPADC
jgi:hypothetical protein